MWIDFLADDFKPDMAAVFWAVSATLWPHWELIIAASYCHPSPPDGAVTSFVFFPKSQITREGIIREFIGVPFIKYYWYHMNGIGN